MAFVGGTVSAAINVGHQYMATGEIRARGVTGAFFEGFLVSSTAVVAPWLAGPKGAHAAWRILRPSGAMAGSGAVGSVANDLVSGDGISGCRAAESALGALVGGRASSFFPQRAFGDPIRTLRSADRSSVRTIPGLGNLHQPNTRRFWIGGGVGTGAGTTFDGLSALAGPCGAGGGK